MSKRNAATEENVLRWIRRGDGQGEGVNFRPFYHVRDVPSKGRSCMVRGLKTDRTHHYLSDVEYGYHLLGEFSDSVCDIREQYALLPREETLEIAQSLGINHPRYQETGVFRVLTSDLVLTMKQPTNYPYLVISCKVASDLDPKNPEAKRTLEKQLLEKTYWERRNVRWISATDEMLSENKVFNLDLIRSTMTSTELDWLNSKLPAYIEAFEEMWSPDLSLNQLLNKTSEKFGINVNHAFTLFGRSIWLKLLSIDLDAAKINHESPIVLNRCPA